jgi:hypothetical protein
MKVDSNKMAISTHSHSQASLLCDPDSIATHVEIQQERLTCLFGRPLPGVMERWVIVRTHASMLLDRGFIGSVQQQFIGVSGADVTMFVRHCNPLGR